MTSPCIFPSDPCTLAGQRAAEAPPAASVLAESLIQKDDPHNGGRAAFRPAAAGELIWCGGHPSMARPDAAETSDPDTIDAGPAVYQLIAADGAESKGGGCGS